MTITFRVPLLPPSVNSCWRRQKQGGYYLTKEANAFINAVGYLAPKTILHRAPGGRYEVKLLFSLQEKDFLRRDLDNLQKIAIDALPKSGIIRDDRYVVRISAEKVSVPGREQEGTEYTVTGL